MCGVAVPSRDSYQRGQQEKSVSSRRTRAICHTAAPPALPLAVAHPGRPAVVRSITAGVWECMWGFLKSTFCLTRDSVSMFLRGADPDFLVVSLPGFSIRGLWPHSFFFKFIYLIYLHVCLPTFMCTVCIQVAAEARRH